MQIVYCKNLKLYGIKPLLMSFLEHKIKYVLLVILDNSLAVKKKLGSHFSRADSREIMSGAGAASEQDGSEIPKP